MPLPARYPWIPCSECSDCTGWHLAAPRSFSIPKPARRPRGSFGEQPRYVRVTSRFGGRIKVPYCDRVSPPSPYLA